MANTQQLRRRITSIKNTRQITKAMEMVAASKLRRAQAAAQQSRQFAHLARQLLTRIRQLTDVNKHPLFKRRTVTNRLIIVIASDRGLAGAYNANLLKHFAAELQADRTNGINQQIITIGKQATIFCTKVKNLTILGAYDDMTDHPTAENLRPILTTVLEGFTRRRFEAVDIIYTDFISTVDQQPVTTRLLPAAFDDADLPVQLSEADFEPSPTRVLNEITERFVEVNLLQYLLEAVASEHAARRLAMKNATDNANEIVDDLTLALNTARQAAITQELAEITGGAEALA